ncbi:hypothetical protein ColLi_12044 [Colletotrichum liriopes]|uniref:Uncharacterized protein n=1 Tax=Colletotrichum liriopes TaxID=708192 RepID=A0AA37GXN0_9PEZI|nr:hypothetical protein ColLi_12044 [Colletotrichum liriopes]
MGLRRGKELHPGGRIGFCTWGFGPAERTNPHFAPTEARQHGVVVNPKPTRARAPPSAIESLHDRVRLRA